jgi:hypothetical protein
MFKFLPSKSTKLVLFFGEKYRGCSVRSPPGMLTVGRLSTWQTKRASLSLTLIFWLKMKVCQVLVTMIVWCKVLAI